MPIGRHERFIMKSYKDIKKILYEDRGCFAEAYFFNRLSRFVPKGKRSPQRILAYGNIHFCSQYEPPIE
ncbi:MAG: hypothetical protein A3F88_05295 [Deltaproteobacteria bacterium RIFCSPLOWO2_12_FULL_42_16]|nr:MAG: hypothetical protein A3F88_05295 [Deltaproteobacteria bacterium RIFCSPLOWO2_12_FULL_42_16]